MLSVRIFNNKYYSQEIDKTVNTICSYIADKLDFKNTKTIRDNHGIEISSGREEMHKGEHVMVELIIRKNIVINTSDFSDRAEMDRHISKIKHFCDQAKEIEELKYLPINMR